MSNLNERDRDMSGVLFINNKKAEAVAEAKKNKDTEAEEKANKQPDFTGNVVVSGTKFALSAWNKEAASGVSFLSVAVREWKDTPPGARQPQQKSSAVAPSLFD